MENLTAKTPTSDLRQAALNHYEEASKQLGIWNSSVPKAINYYFDEVERKEKLEETLDKLKELANNEKVIKKKSDEEIEIKAILYIDLMPELKQDIDKKNFANGFVNGYKSAIGNNKSMQGERQYDPARRLLKTMQKEGTIKQETFNYYWQRLASLDGKFKM